MVMGSCLCGGISFEVEEPIAGIEICYCTQCRKAQGAPLAANIPVLSEQLHWHKDQDLMKAYESSPGKRRFFCTVCGSPMFSERDSLPGVMRLRAGLLDEPISVRPISQAYVADRCSWWELQEGIPDYPGSKPHT